MNTIISCCVRLCFPYSVQSVSEKVTVEGVYFQSLIMNFSLLIFTEN